MLATGLFTAEEFRARVARYKRGDGEFYGDHALNPGFRDAIVRADVRDAAVLIPIVDRQPEATVLLTKRAEALRSHSGQVAFPGGRVDPEDASVEDAALREADEEIGLSRDFVEIIGRMPGYFTGSGYRIIPVIGIVRPGFSLNINPDEVDDAFEVPLSFLMDPTNHRQESRMWQNVERHYYTMPYGEKFIWGATAGIIRALHDGLYQ